MIRNKRWSRNIFAYYTYHTPLDIELYEMLRSTPYDQLTRGNTEKKGAKQIFGLVSNIRDGITHE